MMKPGNGSPFRETEATPVHLQDMVRGCVSGLGMLIGPPAVLRGVVPVGVDPVEACAIWSGSQITIEGLKSFPALADGNPSAAVPVPFDESRVGAARPHSLPSKEFSGVGHAMSRVALDQEIVREAPATPDRAVHHAALADDLHLSTITMAFPKAMALLGVSDLKYDETAKSLTGQLERMTHGWILQ